MANPAFTGDICGYMSQLLEPARHDMGRIGSARPQADGTFKRLGVVTQLSVEQSDVPSSDFVWPVFFSGLGKHGVGESPVSQDSRDSKDTSPDFRYSVFSIGVGTLRTVSAVECLSCYRLQWLQFSTAKRTPVRRRAGEGSDGDHFFFFGKY